MHNNFLMRIYITGKYKTYLSFMYIARWYTETEKYSFARDLLQTLILAQQIIMTG